MAYSFHWYLRQEEEGSKIYSLYCLETGAKIWIDWMEEEIKTEGSNPAAIVHTQTNSQALKAVLWIGNETEAINEFNKIAQEIGAINY